jgi:ATP-binding cassette, subfamily B, bacterial
MTYVVLGAVVCLVSIAGGLAARARLAGRSSGRAADRSVRGGPIVIPRPGTWGWTWLARRILARDRWVVFGLVWLMLLDTGLALAAPWPVKVVIDQILGGQPPTPSLAPLAHLGPVLATTAVAFAGLLLLAVGSMVGYLVSYLATAVDERAAARLREATAGHLLSVPPASLHDYPNGELANRVTSDTVRVVDTVMTTVETVVPETALLMGMALVTTLLDWRLTLIALGVVPVFAVTARIRNRSVEPAARASRTRAGELAALTTDLVSRLPAVHVFAQIGTELHRFGRSSDRAARASIEAVDAGARFTPVTDTLPGLALAAALVAGVVEVHAGRLSLGGLVLFLAYLSSLTTPVHNLAELSGSLARGMASRDRLHELFEIRPMVVQPQVHASAAPALVPDTGVPMIAVEGVRMNRVGALAAGVSFEIASNEFVCLTGPSGAGKTTLLSLLCRLVEPTVGRIRIHGRDLSAIPLAELRQLVTLVPQEPWLHTGTIADNIRYGRPSATFDDVRRVAGLAGAHEFIVRLTRGYQTPVGEHGQQMSGGQQRRIAIARALLCETPVMLLDEPTSGLDRAGRARLIALLRSLTDQTVIVATHHPELASAADRTIDLHTPALPPPRVLVPSAAEPAGLGR